MKYFPHKTIKKKVSPNKTKPLDAKLRQAAKNIIELCVVFPK